MQKRGNILRALKNTSPRIFPLFFPFYLSIYLSIYLSTYLSIDLSIYLSIDLSILIVLFAPFFLVSRSSNRTRSICRDVASNACYSICTNADRFLPFRPPPSPSLFLPLVFLPFCSFVRSTRKSSYVTMFVPGDSTRRRDRELSRLSATSAPYNEIRLRLRCARKSIRTIVYRLNRETI